MNVLTANIEIGLLKLNRVNEIEIERSINTLGATAIIKVPTTARLTRQAEFITEVETAKQFKPGQAVFIELGYNGDNNLEFQGYVRRVNPGTPVEIECEDAIYLLRRSNLVMSWRQTTLKSVLEFILQGTGIKLVGNTPGISFSKFYLKNVSRASALQKIKDDYGLTMYFRSVTELFVGIASESDGTTIKYEFGYNVIDNDLKWINDTDTRIKVKAIYIKPDNTRVEKEFGDGDGELRTLYFYNLEDGKSLKTVAEQELQKVKRNGYEGSVNTFLQPLCKAGNVVALKDPQFAERSGNYLAEKVKVTYGRSGARREITLGLKV
jgi:hypothetical protein